MPQHIKPDPAKNCLTCGAPLTRKRYGKRLEDRGVFLRRMHCSLACGNTKDAVGKSAHHVRAQKFKADACAECSTTKDLHVHHIDRNPENDDPTNLMTLCSSCHLKLHWREDRTRRMDGVRKAQETAKRTGASMRPRSADGRWSSVA